MKTVIWATSFVLLMTIASLSAIVVATNDKVDPNLGPIITFYSSTGALAAIPHPDGVSWDAGPPIQEIPRGGRFGWISDVDIPLGTSGCARYSFVRDSTGETIREVTECNILADVHRKGPKFKTFLTPNDEDPGCYTLLRSATLRRPPNQVLTYVAPSIPICVKEP